jgi:hypothetical protein
MQTAAEHRTSQCRKSGLEGFLQDPYDARRLPRTQPHCESPRRLLSHSAYYPSDGFSHWNSDKNRLPVRFRRTIRTSRDSGARRLEATDDEQKHRCGDDNPARPYVARHRPPPDLGCFGSKRKSGSPGSRDIRPIRQGASLRPGFARAIRSRNDARMLRSRTLMVSLLGA